MSMAQNKVNSFIPALAFCVTGIMVAIYILFVGLRYVAAPEPQIPEYVHKELRMRAGDQSAVIVKAWVARTRSGQIYIIE